MSYPTDDNEFTDTKITKVEPCDGGGWSITRDDGWSNFVPKDSPVEPAVGMTQRTYGRGTAFRAIFLDGQKVFYRTEAEDREHREIEMYGADAADWLARWDAGRGVWSIEMGGIGPGYEQCIQITAAENLRWLLANKIDADAEFTGDKWQSVRERMQTAAFANPVVEKLGLSGAQWGAAVSLATALYKQGPRQIMADPKMADRKIQTRRTFPQAA